MFKLVSLILSSLVFFSLFLNTMILSYHTVNYEYIIAELCIDKDVKESCCKGSCHLASQFDKAENARGSEELFFINGIDLISWFTAEKYQCGPASKTFFEKPNFSFQMSILEGIASRVFHPPMA